MKHVEGKRRAARKAKNTSSGTRPGTGTMRQPAAHRALQKVLPLQLGTPRRCVNLPEKATLSGIREFTGRDSAPRETVLHDLAQPVDQLGQFDREPGETGLSAITALLHI